MSEAGGKSWGTITSVEPPESEAPVFRHDPPRNKTFPKQQYRNPYGKDAGGRRFSHPKRMGIHHHQTYLVNNPFEKKDVSLLSRKRRSSLLGIVIVWFLLLAIFAAIAVGLWLAGSYDSNGETQTKPSIIIHSTTDLNWPPASTKSSPGLRYEVSSEVTFEYYNDAPIIYDPVLIDKESQVYAWWENIFLSLFQQVYGNLDDFVSIHINYLIPGSIIAGFTCVFDDVTHHTHNSLYAYLMSFVDKDGVVTGSVLGIGRGTNNDISGKWNEWQQWGTCSATCDTGQRYRSRTCAENTCNGNSQETSTCWTGTCASSDWNDWGAWGDCSADCGPGTHLRVRTCSTGLPSDCNGLPTDLAECMGHDCGPAWTTWGQWGPCSEPCGGGLRHRARSCETGSDEDCSGMSTLSTEIKTCNTQRCQDPLWDSWQSWTLCTRTCGGGIRSRERQCGTGDLGDCEGQTTEYDSCNAWSCPLPPTPVPPVLGDWTGWSVCSRTCGGGQRTRTRECQAGICVGQDTDVLVCNINDCTNVLILGEWEEWSSCDKSCDRGVRQRQRFCSTCVGAVDYQYEDCNDLPCVPMWLSWSTWSECPVTCGIGNTIRTRECVGVSDCGGPPIETRECDTEFICPTEWGAWTSCSVTCGTGERIRTRYCTTGVCSEVVDCHPIDCFPEPEWSDWSPWGSCTVTCGGGSRQRTRFCTTGIGCYEGSDRETSVCNDILCVKEVRGQLTFVSYNGLSIPFDDGINERGSTSYALWEERAISEFQHVYGKHSSYIRSLINDIKVDFPTATLTVFFTNVYAGDPPITSSNLPTIYREYEGDNRFGVQQE